jgi:hypothetical protein
MHQLKRTWTPLDSGHLNEPWFLQLKSDHLTARQQLGRQLFWRLARQISILLADQLIG